MEFTCRGSREIVSCQTIAIVPLASIPTWSIGEEFRVESDHEQIRCVLEETREVRGGDLGVLVGDVADGKRYVLFVRQVEGVWYAFGRRIRVVSNTVMGTSAVGQVAVHGKEVVGLLQRQVQVDGIVAAAKQRKSFDARLQGSSSNIRAAAGNDPIERLMPMIVRKRQKILNAGVVLPTAKREASLPFDGGSSSKTRPTTAAISPMCRQNRESIKRIILSSLRLRSITKDHADFKDLYQHTLTTVTFTLRSDMEMILQVGRVSDIIDTVLNLFLPQQKGTVGFPSPSSGGGG